MTVPAALSHLTIVDLSEGVAGAYCTKLLADHGATVIRVDAPDGCRGVWREGPLVKDGSGRVRGGLAMYLHTNKQSITLDVATSSGAAILRRLLRQADILVEDAPPGHLDTLGLGREQQVAENPRIVTVSITPFGQSGPYAGFTGLDLQFWALSSMLSGSGWPDRAPVKIGPNLSAYVGGAYGSACGLAAVFGRGEDGEGCHVDVSIAECFFSMLSGTPISYAYTGFVMRRAGNRFPFGILPCKDGWIGMYVPLQPMWEGLVALVEMPELFDEPKYATPMARFQCGDEITERIRPWFMERTKHEIFQSAQELRVPLTIVTTSADILESPQHEARGFITDLTCGSGRPVLAPGHPFVLSATPWALRSPAPTPGQDTPAVLGRLGYSMDDVARLRMAGVV